MLVICMPHAPHMNVECISHVRHVDTSCDHMYVSGIIYMPHAHHIMHYKHIRRPQYMENVCYMCGTWKPYVYHVHITCVLCMSQCHMYAMCMLHAHYMHINVYHMYISSIAHVSQACVHMYAYLQAHIHTHQFCFGGSGNGTHSFVYTLCILHLGFIL